LLTYLLNSFPLGELEEATGMPLYYVDGDYPALNLSVKEAIKSSMAQNRPLWRMMSTFGTMHS